MSGFGALNRWVNKLLDGEVPAEKEDNRTSSKEPKKEERSQDGVNRRAVLAGSIAATVAGPEKAAQAAASTIMQAAPVAATVLAGVGEAAGSVVGKKIAQMAAAMGNDLLLLALREDTDDGKDEIDTMIAGVSDLAESLKSGVKGIEAKKLAEIGNTLTQSEMFGKFFSPDLTIADLSDKELVTTAYGLGGPQRMQGVDINIDNVPKIGELLKKMSGLPGSASLDEVQKVMRDKRIDLAKEILGNLNAFPDAITRQDTLGVLQQMLQDSEEDVEQELFSQVLNARRENLPAYQAETMAKEKQKDYERAKEVSEKLEKRSDIYCRVSKITSGEAGATPTYRVKPQGMLPWGVSRGLNRMHIEHWRQAEYAKAKKLDEYIPGRFSMEERVEDAEQGVAISSDDPVFLDVLEKAAKSRNNVILPNRVQDIPHIKEKKDLIQ